MENRRRSLRVPACADHPPLAQSRNPLSLRGSGRHIVQNLDNVPVARRAARTCTQPCSAGEGGRPHSVGQLAPGAARAQVQARDGKWIRFPRQDQVRSVRSVSGPPAASSSVERQAAQYASARRRLPDPVLQPCRRAGVTACSLFSARTNSGHQPPIRAGSCPRLAKPRRRRWIRQRRPPRCYPRSPATDRYSAGRRICRFHGSHRDWLWCPGHRC